MSGGVFPALGVQPLLGRFFAQQEDDQHQQVCLISYSLWHGRFHADRSVLDSKILLDRKPYPIIGVMPHNFELPLMPGHLNQSQLWVPVSFEEEELTSGASNWGFDMVGRLKRGISPEQAQSDAGRVAQETMRNYPAFMANLRIRAVVHPLHEEVVAATRPLLHMLFLAVSVVTADRLRKSCRTPDGAGDSPAARDECSPGSRRTHRRPAAAIPAGKHGPEHERGHLRLVPGRRRPTGR
jgi:putative ABC transport system permease protein